MSERFERLFSLGENLYVKDSPVLICAGRLLKDHHTGKKLTQIKYKNIYAKQIASLTVRLTLSDAAGRPVGESVTHTYSDLNVGRDEEFGQKVPVFLNEPEACGFDVCVTEVIFGDRSVWTAPDGAEWRPLTDQKKLSEKIPDAELVKQYQIRFGKKCAFYPAADRDLWRCACGALNRENEPVCHSCGVKQTELFSLDMESLKKERDERLEDEAQQKEADRLEQERKAEAVSKKRIKNIAIALPIVAACIAFLIVLIVVIVPKLRYKKAHELIEEGNYREGYSILIELKKPEEVVNFEIDRALSLIDDDQYDEGCAVLEGAEENEFACEILNNRAKSLLSEEQYEKAYALFEAAGNENAVKESKYDRAVELIDSGDYKAAYILLNGLDYKDSANMRKIIEDSAAWLKICPIGGTIFFGSYEQNNNTADGKEDIEWIVLARESARVLVISRYALDCQQYNSSFTSVTWETCSLRKWLNGAFQHAAFSEGEQAMIPGVTVSADKNPKNSTSPGKSTTDQVFLLSITEANKYFSSDEMRKCTPTDYAIAQGAWTSDKYTWTNDSYKYKIGDSATCGWWLRTPGDDSYHAASIEYDGSVFLLGGGVNHGGIAVRPALWINLD